MSKAGNISLVVCGLTMFSSALPAETVLFTEGEMDGFVAALIAVDCIVDSKTAMLVEDATGFSDDKLGVLVEHLLQDGSVVRSDNGEALKLINEGCP